MLGQNYIRSLISFASAKQKSCARMFSYIAQSNQKRNCNTFYISHSKHLAIDFMPIKLHRGGIQPIVLCKRSYLIVDTWPWAIFCHSIVYGECIERQSNTLYIITLNWYLCPHNSVKVSLLYILIVIADIFLLGKHVNLTSTKVKVNKCKK